MKLRMFFAALAAVLALTGLWGCSMTRTSAAQFSPEQAAQSANSPTGTLLTKEEAEAIALEHAGFTADQVTWLRADYEIDDGIPQYEVQFHQGLWEYDYEINAETGAILSYDRDD